MKATTRGRPSVERKPANGFGIAQQNYLLVTEDDFVKAAGVAELVVEG